jgi:hypothetical protein
MRGLFTAVLAASGAASLQIPLQLPLHAPSQLLPWWSSSSSSSSSLPTAGNDDPAAVVDTTASADKPLVNSKQLQALIKGENLMKRAEEFYKFAQKSEDQYNHPTRVIGSQGE